VLWVLVAWCSYVYWVVSSSNNDRDMLWMVSLMVSIGLFTHSFIHSFINKNSFIDKKNVTSSKHMA